MSTVEEIIIWSELRHRIIALQLEADIPKLADDSKQELTYIPVLLGGSGPSDSFWPERRRAVALREEGLSLDEFILQESARSTRSPTREERETQQERELPFLRKLIDLTYEAYRKDWVEQGKEISPAFLWAVRRKVFAAVTLYLMGDEKLTKELLNTSCLHLPVGFAPARLARLLGRLPMSSTSHRRFQATNYINNLVKRIRAEALKLESVGSSLKKEETAAEQEQARGSPQSSGAGAATWDTIEISFLSDERIQIRNGTDTKPYNYAELGFADSRNGKPNQAWLTLRDLAENRGMIKFAERGIVLWPKVEKRIQEIRKALRSHFTITSDPFLFKEGIGYQARFKISTSPSFHT